MKTHLNTIKKDDQAKVANLKYDNIQKFDLTQNAPSKIPV